MEIEKGFLHYLRNTSRQEKEKASRTVLCPQCKAEIQPNIDSFRAHVKASADQHTNLDADADIQEAFEKITLQNPSRNLPSGSGPKASRKRQISGNPNSPEPGEEAERPEDGSDAAEGSHRGSKKIRSPPASDVQQRGSTPPTPGRGRTKPKDSVGDFDRAPASRNTTGRSLWDAGDASGSKVTSQSNRLSQSRQTQHQTYQAEQDTTSYEDDFSTIISQPQTKPISQEQLVAEVKGIYAGLVMVESKCIEVDNAQSTKPGDSSPLGNDQWQALIALHRTLLHEHHDFFLASQHPSASPALRRLASKYAMPARMWRHGIHSFLELLRHKLPGSLEQMLTFIYLAYSMVALLYETVPAFEDTWIECLGDLGRYRMAIEDFDIRDREVWTGVSRYWYSKASDKAPMTGRLHHHLAILARPNALQQLYYYAKSLCVSIPFTSARESIMTLFEPVLSKNAARLSPIDAEFIRVHAILFSGKSREDLDTSRREFLGLLDEQIAKTGKRWLESGYYIGIALCCSLLEYGTQSNALMKLISEHNETKDTAMDDESSDITPSTNTFGEARDFTMQTYETVIRRSGDVNIFPFLNTILTFICYMTEVPGAMEHLEQYFPWTLTAMMLNNLTSSGPLEARVDSKEFPAPDQKQSPRPLPEDHAMRGLVYTELFFPNDWFSDKKIDEDEKYFELASMTDERRHRIVWLGRRIARAGHWLTWNAENGEFAVGKQYDKPPDPSPPQGVPQGQP